MEDSSAPQADLRQTVTLEILRLIKEAQGQHGLKHGDYHRYRLYCRRRIARLRKSLGFLQASGNPRKAVFSNKQITEEMVAEARKNKKDPLRYLLILMTCAERCWSHGMALKQEANTEHRKKFHLLRKLEKSVIYSRALHSIVNNSGICDARSKLESEAYACFMKGTYLFEKGGKWKAAAKYLTKCQEIYAKLCSAINDEEVLTVYQARVEELKPTLRYCAFNLGDKSSEDVLKSRSSVEDDYLVSKLDHLILQTREKQAITLSDVSWLGRTMAVKQEKVRTFLLLVQDTKGLQVGQLERLLFECRDCLQLLRESNNDKTPLYCYLQYLRHELTTQRNIGLIESLEKDTDRIRPYEVIIGSLEDVKSLPLEQHFNANEVGLFMEKVDADILTYKAFRCFYIAKSGKIGWKESVALLHRCGQYIKEALDHPSIEDDVKTRLLSLKKDAEGDKFTIYAAGLIGDNDGDQSNLSSKLLSDRLDDYFEDKEVSSGSKPLTHFPPDFQPIPCKPLFFDLALNHVDLPQLEEGTGAAASGLTGFVKGLWGGGWR